MNNTDQQSQEHMHIAPYDSKGTKGWLFRFKYYPDGRNGKPKHHSKLFSNNKYGGKENALLEAKVYREKWLEENKDILWLKGESRLHLPRNNTSGILGVNRSSRISKTGFNTEQWQTTLTQPDGTKKNYKFSIPKYGELKALRMAIEARKNSIDQFRIQYPDNRNYSIELVNYYTDIISNLDDMKDYSEGPSILEIVREPNTCATTKYDQILIRIGQQRFRREVLEHFDHKCAVTGSHILIRASHIKPWRVSNDEERLDRMNGLALSPTYDAAFDEGVISFRNDGYIMIANSFAEEAELLFMCESDRIQNLSEGHAKNLDWHRKNIFKTKSEPEA